MQEITRHSNGTLSPKLPMINKTRTVTKYHSDAVSSNVRSRMMKAVKQQRTAAEVTVRSIVRQMGLRFCVHNGNLPGSPDLANRRQMWAIFVNGCFWHGHKNCHRGTSLTPRANAEFWRQKLSTNRKRDAAACGSLRRLGFKVVIVWECSLKDELSVVRRLRRMIGSFRGQL